MSSEKKVYMKEDILEMLQHTINQFSKDIPKVLGTDSTLRSLSNGLDKLIMIHMDLEGLSDLRKTTIHNIHLLLKGADNQRLQLKDEVEVDVLGLCPLDLEKVKRYLATINEDILTCNPQFNFTLIFLLVTYVQGGNGDVTTKNIIHPRDALFMKLKHYGDQFLSKSEEERHRVIQMWKLF